MQGERLDPLAKVRDERLGERVAEDELGADDTSCTPGSAHFWTKMQRGDEQRLGDDALEKAGEALVLDEVAHDPHARVLGVEVLVLDARLDHV